MHGTQDVVESWVKGDEMARLLGISERTLRRMVADGQIVEGTTVWMRRTRRYRPSVVIEELSRDPQRVG